MVSLPRRAHKKKVCTFQTLYKQNGRKYCEYIQYSLPFPVSLALCIGWQRRRRGVGRNTYRRWRLWYLAEISWIQSLSESPAVNSQVSTGANDLQRTGGGSFAARPTSRGQAGLPRRHFYVLGLGWRLQCDVMGSGGWGGKGKGYG